jgi:hypothetical protein
MIKKTIVHVELFQGVEIAIEHETADAAYEKQFKRNLNSFVVYVDKCNVTSMSAKAGLQAAIDYAKEYLGRKPLV